MLLRQAHKSVECSFLCTVLEAITGLGQVLPVGAIMLYGIL